MSGKMSNRNRIAQAAAEAAATKKDKVVKADAPAKAGGKSPAKPRAKKAPARVKIVWVVCDQGGKQVKTFPYPQEEAARAEAAQRTTETGKTHFVTRDEVPFDD